MEALVDGFERLGLPLRAIRVLRQRGPAYFCHMVLRRSLGRWPSVKRRLIYTDPRFYWTLRGGEEYYREQEGQPSRTARSCWMVTRIASYSPTSVLEIGCGYGKQIRALRQLLTCPLYGLDFSTSQLKLATQYLDGDSDIHLVQGAGHRLPFADQSFDLILTSAVILHNPPEVAERIRLEILRVARRWAVHNEDLDITYNRYGYDTAAWYRDRGYYLLEAGPIPVDPAGVPSQFSVADLCRK